MRDYFPLIVIASKPLFSQGLRWPSRERFANSSNRRQGRAAQQTLLDRGGLRHNPRHKRGRPSEDSSGETRDGPVNDNEEYLARARRIRSIPSGVVGPVDSPP